MRNAILEFRMPRYREIPNVGLYLEQTIKYINETLAPLDVQLTPSMLSNYVKQGYIKRPVKKQYDAEQIAYLIFIVLAKQTLSMDNIAALFALQRETNSLEDTYNLFCEELENMLQFIMGKKEEPPAITDGDTFAKKTFRSVVIAISHIIYLSYCFKRIQTAEENNLIKKDI